MTRNGVLFYPLSSTSIECYQCGKHREWEVESVGAPVIGKNRREKVCLVCEQEKEKGIFLFGHFLCIDCNQAIVQTNTDDPNYAFYVQKLRKMVASKIYS
ncbi:sigma factor G inhibitor Gin [Geobacillus stearothermophilus]|nr:sigma factor G inhibitor Gin [Geobacillus stearothermophilus]